MEVLSTYQGRQVVWASLEELNTKPLPNKDWVWFVTSSATTPNIDQIVKVIRKGIDQGLLEFKAHGSNGEMLHDLFDLTMVNMEIEEGYDEIEIMTTCHDDETYADAFWQCFFTTCLPESANLDNIKIICTDFDNVDRSNELVDYINKFENGWLPQ